MTSGQLEIVGARECGFDSKSWLIAIGEVAEDNDKDGIEVIDPNDILGQICCHYNVRIRQDEVSMVWPSVATANYADHFDPRKPMVAKEFIEEGDV